MRLHALTTAAMTLLFSGCDPQLTLSAASFVRLDSVAGAIELEVTPDAVCPTFPNVKATQNGTALTQFEKGGSNNVQGHECISPQWVMLDVPHTEEKTTFEFKDAKSSIVAEFVGLTADRTLTVEQPTNAQGQLGDAVRLHWEPVGDRLNPDSDLQIQFIFHDANNAEQTMIVAYASPQSNPGSITFSEGTVAFTLGDPFDYSLPPQTTTEGVLQVVGTNIWVATNRCEGIPKCELGIRAYPSVPFTLVR